MTNKKNIASKLVLALFILTLISCCLLGSTFARYASGGSGKATIGVAEWNIAITPVGESTINVDANKLSPAMTVWQDSGNRTKEGEVFAVATIINSGDVAAKVTVTGEDAITVNLDGATFDDAANGFQIGTADTYAPNQAPTEAQAEALFSVELFTDSEGTTALSDENNTIAANGGTITIYAQVTWTSADSGTSAAYADALDTWVGENATGISFTLSYSAVQASVLPTA